MKSYGTTKIIDWTLEYSNFLSANKNKEKTINRWFPILEGYSSDFVESVIQEQEKDVLTCLDPFAGGGTTPLVAQKLGIRCYSYEVSPFMSQVCRAKLRTDYQREEFLEIISNIRELLEKDDFAHNYSIGLKTIIKNDNLRKWLYHKTAFNSLLNIRRAIQIVTINNYKYFDILNVTLGSILLKYSNVFRDGKALKYKVNWNKQYYKSKQIYKTFIDKCLGNVFLDICSNEYEKADVKNIDFFLNGDCRVLVNQIEDQSVDLVITSPPYLNSRDYTDSHMIELWMLGHVSSYEEVRALRNKTMRSHVQVKWENTAHPKSKILSNRLSKIMNFESKFWNKSIPNMIVGYFCDLENLLAMIKPKLKKDGKLYINVANSSYYGVVIETDRIIEEIATNLGYVVTEIRLGRKIKTSSQQYEEVGWLRETVIVINLR
ncbi:hypothetical protein [Cohnella sp.]|uniref:hypothetical protein n=1 Tax=Cohnella sp. TaxID=1883426 RepID=UPI003703B066